MDNLKMITTIIYILYNDGGMKAVGISKNGHIKLHQLTSGLQRFKFAAKPLLMLHFVSHSIFSNQFLKRIIMSLDVYLIGEEKRVECTCECGHKHSKIEREILYDSNITHNLNKMAGEAGIYEACWRPEEIGATKARDIIGKLAVAVYLMKKEPERFKKFDSPNGWGTYAHFLPWVESYLKACEENPDAAIEVSR